MQGQSQRGGFRGGKRGKSGGSSSGGQGQSQRGGFKGGKRGKSESKNTSSKDKQGQSRRGTTTTAKDVQKAADKINRDFNKRTGFQTKDGFLKDSKGNIVRSKTQVDRVRAEKKREKALRDLFASQIQAQEAKQVTPTAAGLKGFLNKRRKALGVGPFSVEKANQLKNINRALGDFDYTGMSIGNQLRAQSSDFAKGIPGLARAASFVANPALALATGGQGVLGLLNNAGTALGLSPKTSTAQPKGFLKGLFEGLQIGEAPALENQRGGQGRDPMAPIIPLPVDDPLRKGPRTLPFERSEEPVLKDEPLGLDRLKELFPIRMAAQNGGRVQMGYGGMAPMSGMMMSESPTVVMNVANSGIGGILEKFKQIRSEM
jgi:hypothetical protein